MSTVEHAKQILADHRSAPPPIAGRIDKDADLIERIDNALYNERKLNLDEGILQGRRMESNRIRTEVESRIASLKEDSSARAALEGLLEILV